MSIKIPTLREILLAMGTKGNSNPLNHDRYTDAEARAASVSDTAYSGSWDAVTTIAPSKNALYDKIQTLTSGGGYRPYSALVVDQNAETGEKLNGDLVFTGVAATDRANLVTLVSSLEARALGNYVTLRFTPGHYDLDNAAVISLTKVLIDGGYSQHVDFHFNGTGANAGFKCIACPSDENRVGGIKGATIITDDGFTGKALEISSNGTTTRIHRRVRHIDDIVLRGGGVTAGSKGLYIATSGTDSYISGIQLGQIYVWGYETGYHCLCAGTHSSQGPFINTLGIDGLYIIGSTNGALIENNSNESNSLQAHVYNRMMLSNIGTRALELKVGGGDYVAELYFPMLIIMDPPGGANQIVCGASCNDNYFRGYFTMAGKSDSGSRNRFRPMVWSDENEIVRTTVSESYGATADLVQVGGVDISAGHRALSIGSEETVATEAITGDRSIQVVWNGSVYKIPLKFIS